MMRDFVKLIYESTNFPTWFLEGHVVDIKSDRFDAAEFLEGNEFNYEWRLCEVPFEIYAIHDFSPMETHSETAAERLHAIKDWAVGVGGLKKALLINPPIALWSNDSLHNLDGYHRRGIATMLKLPAIPMLIAVGDPDLDDDDIDETIEEPIDEAQSPGMLTIYRGEYSGNKGGNFWTTDMEFARQFTQSGLEREILVRYIWKNDIDERFSEVYGGDPDAIDAAVAEAKDEEYKALWLDEGPGQPKSIFVFDRSALMRYPR